MNIFMTTAGALGISYLLGSIPFGLLIATSRGVDIRRTGSCNIGATNVMRSVGKGWGILTLLLDVLKGMIPAAGIPALLVQLSVVPESHAWLKVACGTAAVLGHNFPVFLGFKGGKGVATSAGVLLGIAPLALLIGVGCFAITFGISRFVSLGSLAGAIAIAIAGVPLYYADHGPLIPAVLMGLALLVIWRHKQNIERLLKGTENRISFTRKRKA